MYTIENQRLNTILADMLMDNLLNQIGISVVEEEIELKEDVIDLVSSRNLLHVLDLLAIDEKYFSEIAQQFEEKVGNLNEYPSEVEFNEAVNVNCIEFVSHLMKWSKEGNFPTYTAKYEKADLDFEISLN